MGRYSNPIIPSPTKPRCSTKTANGTFHPLFFELLRDQPDLIDVFRRALIDQYFPNQATTPAPEPPLLGEATPPRYQTYRRPDRDPQFRTTVLAAYDHRCAVTRLRTVPPGVLLDAAHLTPFSVSFDNSLSFRVLWAISELTFHAKNHPGKSSTPFIEEGGFGG